MATLNTLEEALGRETLGTTLSLSTPLSDKEYYSGFLILQNSEWDTYQNFIFTQLAQVLEEMCSSRDRISVLEIGPGPRSVLGYLPRHIRRSIRKYVAFEPNDIHATSLESWIRVPSGREMRLPLLESPPQIYRERYEAGCHKNNVRSSADERFDLVLFCHSMYGMKPQRDFIERALGSLTLQPAPGQIVVFHRDGRLHFDGLVCHRTAKFPNGVVRVENLDHVLDEFATFIARSPLRNGESDEAIRIERRRICRTLGGIEKTSPNHLAFSSPNVMVTFTAHATALPELAALVPMVGAPRKIKNQEARLHQPAAFFKPTRVEHVQHCVRWALEHDVGLTVIGGSHSGHCLVPNVVAVDMGAFDTVNLHLDGDLGDGKVAGAALAVVEAGCKTDDVIRKTMESGLTVPLGSRPSVGAGLWLQGGIGHLSRLHGLACDAIVGAVLVSLTTGEVLVIGCVPFQQQPAGARRPDNDDELLWALKGAGTNSGVVISVTFTTYPAPIFQVRNWLLPLRDKVQALEKIRKFDEKIARRLPRARSADAYLYWDDGQLQLGVAMIEVSLDNDFVTEGTKKFSESLTSLFGPESSCQVVDSVGMFETEMYLSGMHGGHGGGKTSSFKRCLFIKGIGTARVLQNLSAAIENRPSPLCYLHLLQGGGAVGDVAEDGTAFGCRDWDFACVITGVWPRCEDDTQVSRACVSWVYKVAEGLLPLCSGVYSADLGPDPRDALLATKAFGPNRPRLSRIKEQMDPRSVLAYTCPLPKVPKGKLVVLVTGKTCAGKDYCAQVWASVFNEHAAKGETAEVVSISEQIKREYAAVTGADLQSLLHDRAYKEQHRRELTAFFRARMRRQPRLPEQHFLDVVFEASDADVLFITGMRDETPVVALSHLVADCRLVEVRVNATNTTRSGRGGVPNDTSESNNSDDDCNLKYRPTHVFCNDRYGDQAARKFARECLLPYVHRDLTRLADMVSHAADFPRPGVEFRHVLDISQKPGGLPLCASLLQSHFAGAWAEIDRIVCCEAGGFLFASALALKTNLPLALIREAGKLPTPTVSAKKQPSHISSFGLNEPQAKRMEIGRDVITPNGSVVVVDDVLATGETSCAVLELLRETGVNPEQVSVMVVAEFPVHRGRALLRESGFGEVIIQSLLVFGGR